MMARLLFTLLLSLALCSDILAQPSWKWARKDSNVSYSISPAYARQVMASYKNNKVLWGVVQNKKITYGQVMMGDYILHEVDSNGAKTSASAMINGRLSLSYVQSDSAGNWYVLGSFYDTVSIGNGMMLTRNSAGTGAEYFIARFHAGTLAPDWLQLIGSNYHCKAVTFTIAPNNKLYMPMDSTFSTYLVNYDLATGARNITWAQMGRSTTSIIQADGLGNIYLVGSCLLNGALNFNGTTINPPSSNAYPWYIARYHANGQYHWHHFITDITCTNRSIRLGNSNALYLTGLLSDTCRLGSHFFNQPPGMFNRDYILARLDSTGNVVWAQQRPGSTAQANINFSTNYHSTTDDSTLYLLCETQGTSDWGSGVSSNTNLRHQSTLVAYNNTTGMAKWVKTIGGKYSVGTQLMSDGYDLWITGSGGDSTALNFDAISIPSAAAQGEYVPYLAKLKLANRPTNNPPPTTVNNAVAKNLFIWPNPTKGFVNIEGLTGDESIAIIDLTGRKMMDVKASGSSILLETIFLTRGVYFLEVSSQSSRKVVKLICE